ncbi:hypothetical protein D1B31_16110 [Neobacillus notoginsengisoli]|uniref:Uncharacterized protein n=1 Tax=Neobacillus notoginsengisoli TaxID=1578198 RepID=A0A417YR11_9BACI|nr:hypothetical protein [Neobacillus notoginsengisoli]RHW37291.1 hypothetical protein D1B31_16110 [Neobacillus notoginsengisoli]
MNITITGIFLDEHKVEIPAGLSELINSAGAWGKRQQSELSKEYDRKVIKRDGQLVTLLFKKE